MKNKRSFESQNSFTEVNRINSVKSLRNFEENIILKEVAELVTGIRGTKSDDLTDEYLQAVARGEKPALP